MLDEIMYRLSVACTDDPSLISILCVGASSIFSSINVFTKENSLLDVTFANMPYSVFSDPVILINDNRSTG
ncbi:hypothetical protein SDC9_193550 [bioreactor metagenome]|uniref:Uncharacterized protein n=1 Tax=bioreactor metagenome TaxID=1076179 RepID=A0A645I3V6_9ZZZZ